MIRLNDVQVGYGSLMALDGVSFQIESGAVGLLGPNGAGKSTLLKTLLGFLRARGGEVEMFGMPMPKSRLEVRQRLGYMPEKDVVSPRISAVSFLTYCGRLFGMSRVDAMERCHEVLNYVGMGDNRYRKMETYSTGMCQRVKFAQALIHDPRLLLLDEPTNGLDPEGRVEMLELIRELAHKRGVTVLLSSHLMPDVAHVCDRVIVIHKGCVARDASVSELTALQDNLVEVSVRDNVEVFLDRLRASGCSCHGRLDGHLIIHKPSALTMRAFFEMAQASDTQIRHFEPVRQRLEEAFMDAIGARHGAGQDTPDETLTTQEEPNARRN